MTQSKGCLAEHCTPVLHRLSSLLSSVMSRGVYLVAIQGAAEWRSDSSGCWEISCVFWRKFCWARALTCACSSCSSNMECIYLTVVFWTQCAVLDSYLKSRIFPDNFFFIYNVFLKSGCLRIVEEIL